MMAKPASVDDYIAARPPAAQKVLQRVRRVIRKALPRAEEVIAYQMPAFRLDGRIVLYFAGWKEHYSLYPASQALAAKFRRALAPYETSGRGTIRFPLSAPVPAALIAGIARFRVAENAARRAAARGTSAAKRGTPRATGAASSKRAARSSGRSG
jgi:uncharacterized protein YdhG (YjbR/CyaY superfamily)